ncbi:MAG: SdiA-regulated domain-containing protein [Myxococcaceae bacterium]|nr:SdiA-regulated domain-containing protein [Myxococcaceae bacterium]
MRQNIDLGAVLSLAAVAAVSLSVTFRALPDLPPPIESPVRAPPTHEGEPLPSPTEGFELDKSLKEISGLAVATDGTSLWAVHDEKATLFRISVKDGSIVQKVDLGEPGDYETVEVANGRVWVGRSDGTLLVIDPAGAAKPEKLTFTQELGVPCDLEGMAWDVKRTRMLFACKNESVKSKKTGKTYPVFALDVVEKKMEPDPVISLTLKGKAAGPSALAVHPKTGDLYMLSSQGNALRIFSPEGELKKQFHLDDKVHRQPEGIAIGEDGTMYISNEARGKKAMLFIFKPDLNIPGT